MASQRKWWRLYFNDHPLYIKNQQKALRPPEVWANSSKDKVRVFCQLCLEQEIGSIIQDEENRQARGEQIIVRTRDAIKLALFNVPPNQPGVKAKWIESCSETLLTHLKHCSLQDNKVHAHAAMGVSAPDPNQGSAPPGSFNPGGPTMFAPPDPDATPRTQRTYQLPIASPCPVPFFTNQPPPMSQWDVISSRLPTAQQPDPFSIVPSNQPFPTHSILPQPPVSAPVTFLPQMTQEAISRMYSNSPATSFFSTSSSGSGGRLPSVSRVGTPSYPPAKFQRTASGAKRPSSAFLDNSQDWTEERQKDFETSLMRLIASAGLSLNWVSNPEFLAFCQRFIPGAKVPSRKSLTYRIMPRVLNDIRFVIKAQVHGQLVTVQCDGWTGPNSHHLIAFMVTTSEGKVYTVKVFDTTVEHKTAENLLAQMNEVLDILKHDWNVRPIAFTTDASGESKKARRLLREQQRNLVTPDCYAHQVNLIVGDYFKVHNVDFLNYASQANELITWLRSKTAVLGLIKQALEARGRQPLSVIHPVPTRWTAYYLAYRWLLDLRPTLDFIIADDAQKPEDDRLVIPKDRAAKEKANAMVAIIKENYFWLALARIKHHLAPLAITANVTQSVHCHLDDVLLTFASLAMEYTLNLTETIDAEVKDVLLSSIEKRWDQSDQEVFIAAVILNPFLKTNPFTKDAQLLSLGSIHALLSGLWDRFYGEPAPDDLYENIHDYLSFTGFYSAMENVCTRHKATAANNGESPRPLDAYADITIVGQTPPLLIHLAIHILSICPNSASCERLFSTFGLILTKLRTRLHNQRVVDLAECKMHVRDEHIAKDAKKNLHKRVFGARAENPTLRSQASNLAIATSAPSATISSTLSLDPTPLDQGNDDNMSPGSTRTTQSLRTLTSRHIAMLDEVEDISMASSAPNPSTRGFRKRRISELFDFTSNHWVKFAQRSATGSLEDEMELYDLLDLDAEGDLDYDLDDCLESVLTVWKL